MGALMICVAVLIATDADTRFQTAIADDLPAFLVNPTGEIEDEQAVASRAGRGQRARGRAPRRRGRASSTAAWTCPRWGWRRTSRAPSRGSTPRTGQALRMDELRGQVVLIDFWTYTCINCIRTFPHLKAWDEEYRDDGLTIVGVHTPEFPFERDAGNVADAVEQNEIRYPVAQDNEFGTWSAYGNQYWPAKYLIDAEGQVRYVHFGEGEYETTERAIRTLLREKGDDELGAGARASAETANPATRTPETYLGSARAEGWVDGPIRGGTRASGPRPASSAPEPSPTAAAGRSRPTAPPRRARPGSTPSSRPRRCSSCSARPARPGACGCCSTASRSRAASPARTSAAAPRRSREQRLYRLIDLPEAGRHRLQLRFDPGIEGYAFTFG